MSLLSQREGPVTPVPSSLRELTPVSGGSALSRGSLWVLVGSLSTGAVL